MAAMSGRGRAFAGRRGDAILALVVGLAQVGGTYVASLHQTGRRPLDAVGVALLALGALVVIDRRQRPVAVLAVAFVATLAYSLLDYPGGPIFLGLIVAFHATQTAGHRVTGVASIIGGYGAFVWLQPAVAGRPAPSVGEAVAIAAWMSLLLVTAEVVRVRRAYRVEVGRRAEEAERTREEETRRRHSEERLRIARELHDVLAHNISLMNVRASTALHVLDERPEEAAPALAAIKQASSEALGELRSVLNTLRQVDEAPDRVPAPTLTSVDDLVAQARAAGIKVETRIDGAVRQLSAPVERAAFRICQEALTNVIRHAGAATVELRLNYGSDELVVQVQDDGHGAAANGHGHGGNGIPGMRERATGLGGRMVAGPRPGGGYRVRAQLPVEVDS